MAIFKSQNDINDWYELLNRAKQTCGYDFSTGLDHYLALTLQEFMNHTELASNTLALTYLENSHQESHETLQNIRYVGDQCLILSGLFPESALKKNVSLSYYIDLGKNAYMRIAGASTYLKIDNELFYELGTHFVGAMDLLQTLRHKQS